MSVEIDRLVLAQLIHEILKKIWLKKLTNQEVRLHFICPLSTRDKYDSKCPYSDLINET